MIQLVYIINDYHIWKWNIAYIEGQERVGSELGRINANKQLAWQLYIHSKYYQYEFYQKIILLIV